MASPDEIFLLNQEYIQDSRKEKINGGIGVYLNDEGEAYVMPVVKKVISHLPFSNFNYLPIRGDNNYVDETAKLILGQDLFNSVVDRIASQGTIGGTNGLYLWGCLVKYLIPKPTIILSNPTWENHKKIFSYLGFKIVEYQHLTSDKKLNVEELVNVITNHPRSFILLQGGPTHNPTGVNPNNREWEQLVELIQANQIQVLFDFAYMGLGDSPESDCEPLRKFIETNIPMTIIFSYSKNMTLYQHRVGAVYILTKTRDEKKQIQSCLSGIFRSINSNPAAFGELIVKNVLSSNELKDEWLYDLHMMQESLTKRRRLFVQKTHSKFPYVMQQKGLFSLLELSPAQIEILKNKNAIYLLKNGRLNFGGIGQNNMPRLCKAILQLK